MDEDRTATTVPGTSPTVADDDRAHDEPIAYDLTARARRAVAPASLPNLTLLTSPIPAPDEDAGADPFDTRPARARALRRAGRSVSEVAAALAVDTDVVAAWTDEVAPRRRARRGTVTHLPAPVVAPDEALERIRAAARDELAAALAGGDTGFVARAGLVVGAAEVTAHAVLLTVRGLPAAAAALGVLEERARLDRSRVRIALRVGADEGADVIAHRWADHLGVPGEHVTGRRERTPVAAVVATVRIGHPGIAAVVAGWSEALLADGSPS